jgi:hypothetical protein
MNKVQRLIVLVLIFSIALACNLPSGAATESPVPGAGDGSPSPTATETITPTVTGVPPTACTPQIVTNTDSNVRSGPGQVYSILGQLTQSSTATVDGKNSDGTWWYIQFPAGPNGHGWIAGSITTATCIPDTLAIIAAPPTPIPPSFTPTYTPTNTPTITSTPGLIIVLPPIFIIPSSTPTPFIIVFPTINFPNP